MMFIFILSDDDGVIFAMIYEKHKDDMIFKATEILGKDSAEDAVHDAIIRLIEAYDGRIEDLRLLPKSFFTKVVKNLSLNKIESEKTFQKHINIEYVDDIEKISDAGAFNPERVLTMAEAYGILEKHLKKLGPENHGLLALKYYHSLTNRQLAKIYDLTETAVSSRINRAMEKLRNDMQREGIIIEN